MYIPSYSAVPNLEILKDFVRAHSFGTLVSGSSENLDANHYPFLMSEDKDGLVLWTHLSRSNPQWRNIDESTCLVMFTGPHSYISPSYYVDPLNVPTWSYTAVHAKGKAEVLSDSNLEKDLMKKLVEFYEHKNGTNWKYDLPKDFDEKLLKAIVWIKIKVTSFEGKFKLGQNRNEEDYVSLVSALSQKNSENITELLHYMKLGKIKP